MKVQPWQRAVMEFGVVDQSMSSRELAHSVVVARRSPRITVVQVGKLRSQARTHLALILVHTSRSIPVNSVVVVLHSRGRNLVVAVRPQGMIKWSGVPRVARTGEGSVCVRALRVAIAIVVWVCGIALIDVHARAGGIWRVALIARACEAAEGV
eukprot:3120112-Rhodomonas_salina.3